MDSTEIELHRLDLAYADLRVGSAPHIARFIADISVSGQRQPVLVARRDDRLVLIDGYCRVEALRRLGRDTVHALILPLPEREALLFAYRSHVGRRRSALEDGWLMRELIEQFGLKQSELAEALGRSESYTSRRLALVRQLPESIQDAVRKGRIGAHAAQRSLVPLARANLGHAERLVSNLSEIVPTSRQLAALVAAWIAADHATRERIVDHPALFLKAEEAEPLPGPAPTMAAELVRVIETIAGACHGARKVLRRADLSLLDEAEGEAVARAMAEAVLAFASVRRLLAEEGHDA